MKIEFFRYNNPFTAVTGQTITCFSKDLKELDAARKGISVKTLPALDAKQTAPKKELPHLAPTLDHKKYTPVQKKVKEENEETWKNVSDVN